MKSLRSSIQLLSIGFVLVSCETYEDHAFDEWDTDNNGVISQSNYKAAWTELQYYETWDTNADGVLDPDEWNLGLQRFGYDPSEPVYGYFNDWDVDGNNRLREEEFSDELFELWDENQNGEIDKQEYGDRYSVD